MALIDLDGLRAPVSDAVPGGDDVGADPDFIRLSLAVEGTAERGADAWRPLREIALQLAERTKDLRVYLWLTRALTNTDGLAGLASGLALLCDGIERYWDELHPALDPDDEFDAGQRVAYLEELADRGGLVGDVRAAPLVSARGVGTFNLQDVRVATGAESAPDGRAVPDPNLVEAAFKAADPAELEAMARAAVAAAEHARALERAVSARLGEGAPRPQLDRLHGALATVIEELGKRTAMPAPPPDAGAAPVRAAGNGAAAPTPTSTPADGRVNSRDDVIRALDRILEYYARAEPSSPVPLLLNRAKRLVKMDFLEAIEELAPSGLSEVQKLGGLAKGEGKAKAEK